MTDEQMTQYGNALAVALYLKRDRDHSDRWQTSWGTKTGKGLYLTIKRMIEAPEELEQESQLQYEAYERAKL